MKTLSYLAGIALLSLSSAGFADEKVSFKHYFRVERASYDQNYQGCVRAGSHGKGGTVQVVLKDRGGALGGSL